MKWIYMKVITFAHVCIFKGALSLKKYSLYRRILLFISNKY